MKIDIISDTHVPTMIPELPAALVARLREATTIIHAGDFVTLEVLRRLQTFANVVAVHGNGDGLAIKAQLPRKQVVTLADHRVGIIHGDQPTEIERGYRAPGIGYDDPEANLLCRYLIRELPDAEIIVFGHLHVPVVKRWVDPAGRERLFINPGAVAESRRTYALLEIDADTVRADIVPF